MKAKERVKRALERKEPDRVPVFPVITSLHAARVTGIKYRDIVLNPWLNYEALLRAWRLYRFDGFEVGLSPKLDKDISVVKVNGEEYLERGGKLIARLQERDMPIPLESEIPIKEEKDLEKIKIKTWREYIKEGQIEPVRRVLEEVGEDAFIAGTAASQSMNFLVSMRGPQQALLDLIDNPKLAHRIMEIGTEISIQIGYALIEAGVDAIYIGDAWASSTIISPSQYKEFCFPYHKKATEAFHKKGIPVYLHICGNCMPILEYMAETGVDAIEPLDPLGGVDIEEVKRRVGDKVCLKGGVNTLTLLRGTPEDVMREAKYCIEKAGKGGGYILGSGDDIPTEASIENVRAMVEAAEFWGRY
ncbi:uroporphyrinogen decarboxylase family protein [bacterium]|nr:uroporphyrinogen decarboxylase family protein [bacterium]